MTGGRGVYVGRVMRALEAGGWGWFTEGAVSRVTAFGLAVAC